MQQVCRYTKPSTSWLLRIFCSNPLIVHEACEHAYHLVIGPVADFSAWSRVFVVAAYVLFCILSFEFLENIVPYTFLMYRSSSNDALRCIPRCDLHCKCSVNAIVMFACHLTSRFGLWDPNVFGPRASLQQTSVSVVVMSKPLITVQKTRHKMHDLNAYGGLACFCQMKLAI